MDLNHDFMDSMISVPNTSPDRNGAPLPDVSSVVIGGAGLNDSAAVNGSVLNGPPAGIGGAGLNDTAVSDVNGSVLNGSPAGIGVGGLNGSAGMPISTPVEQTETPTETPRGDMYSTVHNLKRYNSK